MKVGANTIQKPGTIVTYPEDLKWEAVRPLDENGRGIFVSLLYGDLKTKGPTNFLMSRAWPYSINSLTIGRDYILIGYYAASDDDHVFDASPFYR